MSEFYDNRYSSIENTAESDPPEDIVLDAIKHLQAGASVIDIGSGQGRNALALARRGFEVVAQDTSSVAVEQVRALAEKTHLPNLKAEIGDAKEELSQNYDLIISTFILHHLSTENGLKFIENMKSHTNPGGLNAIAAQMREGDLFNADKDLVDTLYVTSKLLEDLYRDWEIVSSYVENREMAAKKRDGTPMHNMAISFLARKPKDLI